MAIAAAKDMNSKPVVTTEGTPVYETLAKKASLHKALDFSNIGMPITTLSGANSGNERHLRQFHQTRIFVEGFSGMNHHGKAEGQPATYLISANLPQSLSYGLSSTWQAPLSGMGNSTTNAIMQFGSQLVKDHGAQIASASGIHRATTFLIWGGAKPLEMTIKIPVIDDNYGTKTVDDISTNLAEALEFLSCLCLPAEGNTGANFYTPPPSPLNFSVGWGDKSLNLHLRYARIMVQLGGILLIDNCIIKSINVSYPNTKTLIKHTYPQSISPGSTGMTYLTPLLAEVSITLSTIEAVTANAYSKMLWLKPQNDMSNVKIDLKEIWEGAKEVGKGLMNAGKAAIGME